LYQMGQAGGRFKGECEGDLHFGCSGTLIFAVRDRDICSNTISGGLGGSRRHWGVVTAG